MRSTFHVRAALAVVLLALAAACVKIPGEVEAQFAPAQPYEKNNFRRRTDAPSPMGYVTEADLARLPGELDAGQDASPEAGADGAAPLTQRMGDMPTTARTIIFPAAADASADGASPAPASTQDGGTP